MISVYGCATTNNMKAGVLMKSADKTLHGKTAEKLSIKQLSTILTQRGIRPSQQRLMILEYLMTHRNHPSVDMIYNALLGEVPTLSRATVYNTLNLFLDAGLVKALDIVENESRYDIMTTTHGHFKCKVCGEIFNFGVDETAMDSEDLSGFEVEEKNVYYKGICPSCLKKSRKK